MAFSYSLALVDSSAISAQILYKKKKQKKILFNAENTNQYKLKHTSRACLYLGVTEKLLGTLYVDELL